jgi:Protein of unknown function (DUF2922).
MNKNYYEFVFVSDQGKNINLKIPNAIETFDTDQFAEDMDLIIASNVILTSAGKPVAKRFVKYIEPKIIEVTIQNN